MSGFGLDWNKNCDWESFQIGLIESDKIKPKPTEKKNVLK